MWRVCMSEWCLRVFDVNSVCVREGCLCVYVCGERVYVWSGCKCMCVSVSVWNICGGGVRMMYAFGRCCGGCVFCVCVEAV